MGWTSYNVPTTYDLKKRRYTIDRKAECDKLYNGDNFEVLKSAMVGSTYYAAIRAKRSNEVFATVVLTHTNMSDYWNFSYKDMDETCGPCESKCPMSILKLLTETDSEYAKAWRQRCYDNLKKPSLSKLPVGSKIKFEGFNGERTLIKMAPAYQFKTNWWLIEGQNKYFPKAHIPDNWELVTEKEVSV